MLGVLYTGSGYPWDLTPTGNTAKDLNYLKSIGVQWIRTGVMPYSYSKNLVPNGYEAFIVFVKSYGFKVLTGVGASIGFSVYQDWWQGFIASIPAYAAWAQSVGIDVFCIGNEEATHNFTGPVTTPAQVINGVTMTNAQILPSTQIHNDVRGAILTAARANFSGPILYTGSSGEMPEFIANGIGSLDILGHNQYDNLSNFTSKISATLGAFGPNQLWVTEWNTQGGYNAFTLGGGYNLEAQYETENLRRFQALNLLNLSQSFLFAYGATNSAPGTNTTYGLLGGTGTSRSSVRILRDSLFGAAGTGRRGYCY